MDKPFPALSSDNILVIFTTAPTGLGHIRVMDGVRDGLHPSVSSVSIGVDNVDAGKIHAWGSRIPLFIKLTEFSQSNKFAEYIVTKFYINYLQRKKKQTLESLASVALDYPERRHWVIISTHYALAYSILAAKTDLEKNFNVKIYLFQVVTDDSSQRVWAVRDANLIFVPSEKTKEGLKKLGVNEDKLRVISFPISPNLSQKLSKEDLSKIESQLAPNSKEPIHIEIPISGAAVQLPFFERLINILSKDLFRFTVVGVSSPMTIPFFERILKFSHVQTSIGSSANQTVNLYESVFKDGRPTIEITKPSEQAFKAIISPNKVGGVILLLTTPVGRQEKDNLDFLLRHKLMPTNSEQKELESGINIQNLQAKATHWRAIRLPNDPTKAAEFIKKLRDNGVFSAMLSYVAEDKKELTSDGCKQLWEEINGYLESLK